MANDAVSEKVSELVGGLMNAINRGESLEQAKASFLNAGYPRDIVELASRGLSGESYTPSVSASSSVPSSTLKLYAVKNRGSSSVGSVNVLQQSGSSNVPSKRVVVHKKSSSIPYWAVILMLLLSLAIVIGAGILGLYWNRLFPPG